MRRSGKHTGCSDSGKDLYPEAGYDVSRSCSPPPPRCLVGWREVTKTKRQKKRWTFHFISISEPNSKDIFILFNFINSLQK